MRHKTCPVCGLAVDVGSHWDCVFDLLAEWAMYREKDKRELKPAAGEEQSADLGEKSLTPAPAPASVSIKEEGVENG